MGFFDSLLPGEEPPRISWRKALVRLLLSVGIFTAVFYVADLEWEHVREGLQSVGPRTWGATLLAFLLLHGISALKWRLFLRLAGAHLTVGEALRFYAAGLFSNLCLPSLVGGDAVRAGLAMTRGSSKAAVLLGGAVDRIFDLVALGILVAAGCLFAPDALARMEAAEVAPLTILAVFFGLLGAGVVSGLVILKLRPPSTWPILSEKGESLLRALRTARSRPAMALGGLGLCVAIQSGFVGLNAYLAEAVEVGLDGALWFLLFPLAKIAAMMPISLGGIGVREAALHALASPFGAEVQQLAVVQSVVWETVLVSGGLLAGLVWLATGLRSAARSAA